MIFVEPLFSETWKCFAPFGKTLLKTSSSSMIRSNFRRPFLMSGKVGSTSVTNRYFLIDDFFCFLLFCRIFFLLLLKANFMNFLSIFSSG